MIDLNRKDLKRIFFVGIGGISMSGLANLALDLGFEVAGSDQHPNARCAELEARGARIFNQHSAQNLESLNCDLLCYSAAIAEDNPERSWARTRGLTEVERSEFLGAINRLHHEVINIAGTNGKTTTTSICAYLMVQAGLAPTVHVGAEVEQLGGTVLYGPSRQIMVSEACEFHRSFLAFHSTTAAILNIEHDHIDCYPQLQDVIEVFADFVCQLEAGSKLLLPSFDPNMPALFAAVKRKKPSQLSQLQILRFGLQGELDEQGHEPDFAARLIPSIEAGNHFEFFRSGQSLGEFCFRLPGRFNVDNACAALALALLHGVEADTARHALQNFEGAAGRFSPQGQFHGAQLIADYAHAPGSVALTIQAAREHSPRRVIACFQPITYSRAAGFFPEYVEALAHADLSYLAEVFDDREKDHSFSSRQIAEALRSSGHSASYFQDLDELEAALRQECQAGDIVLFMGQNIRQLPQRLREK